MVAKRNKKFNDPDYLKGIKNYGSYSEVLGISTDINDGLASIHLFFDHVRYMFNAGEGFQRFCNEHSVRYSKVGTFLLTRISPDAIGGIPGYLCSKIDMFSEDNNDELFGDDDNTALTIYGPKGLQKFVESVASYTNIQDLDLTIKEIDDKGGVIMEDHFVKIQAIPLILNHQQYNQCDTLEESSQGGAEQGEGKPLQTSQEQTNNSGAKRGLPASTEEAQPKRIRRPIENSNNIVSDDSKKFFNKFSKSGSQNFSKLHNGQVIETDIEQAVVCYVYQLDDVIGKFHPDKAAQLGVPKGPLYGQLQRGEAVENSQGRTIQPNEVIEAAGLGPTGLVIDCPTLEHIDLLNKVQWADYIPKEAKDLKVSKNQRPISIFHLAKPEIFNSQEYHTFVLNLHTQLNYSNPGFPELKANKIIHVLANSETDSEDNFLYSQTRLMAQLNSISNDLFQIPHFIQKYRNLHPSNGLQHAEAGKNVQNGHNGNNGKAKVMNGNSYLETNTQPEIKYLNIKDVQIAQGRSLTKIHQRPQRKQGIDQIQSESYKSENDFDQHQNAYIESQKQKINNLQKLFSEYKPNLPDYLKNLQRDECELIFLGTGSSKPQPKRNVAAQLINLFDRGAILMDCAEGTYGQLIRAVGIEMAEDILLNKLKIVWISHLHADHHVGLYKLLARRKELEDQKREQQEQLQQQVSSQQQSQQQQGANEQREETLDPLIIIAPTGLRKTLRQYSELYSVRFRYINQYSILDHNISLNADLTYKINDYDCPLPQIQQANTQQANNGLQQTLSGLQQSNSVVEGVKEGMPKPENYKKVDEILEKVKNDMGIKDIVCARTQHFAQPHALRVQGTSGWSISYTSDTRPCQSVVDLAKDSTILIHEATFEDALLQDAINKRHSTISEALQIAEDSNAYSTILTHFSQRYSSLPPKMKSQNLRIIMAFDFMRVNILDVGLFPLITPALKEILDDASTEISSKLTSKNSQSKIH